MQQPANLRDAVVKPLLDYLSRQGAITALVFILLYKCGDAVAGGMLTPFLIKTGFSNSEIGAVSKGMGLASTIFGVMLGGGLVASWGLRRSLLVFGCLQAVTNTLFAVLAVVGKSHTLLVVSIASDQLFGGMATAAFGAFLLTLCNKRYSAFQFALLSAASALGRDVLGGMSGWLAQTFGWAPFFLLTVALAAPALLALSFLSIERLTPEEA